MFLAVIFIQQINQKINFFTDEIFSNFNFQDILKVSNDKLHGDNLIVDL